MPATPARTRRRLRWFACRAIAWMLCVGGLLSGVLVAFRGVDAHARTALAAWRVRRHSADGDLLAIVHEPLPPLRLATGTVVEQEFWGAHDGLCALRVEVRAPEPGAPSPLGEVQWRLVDLDAPPGTPRRLAAGTLDAAAVAAAGWYEVSFPALPTSAGGRYQLKLLAPADPAAAAPALALYTSPEARPAPVVTGAAPDTPPRVMPIGTALHMRILYAAPANAAEGAR